MSTITVNARNVDAQGVALSKLGIGETFKFVNGQRDHVYIKVSDQRTNYVNGDVVLDGRWDEQFYVSLTNGETFRAVDPNTTVVPVNIRATVSRF